MIDGQLQCGCSVSTFLTVSVFFFGYIRYFQDISRYNVAEMPNDLSGLMLICVCVSTVYRDGNSEELTNESQSLFLSLSLSLFYLFIFFLHCFIPIMTVFPGAGLTKELRELEL